MTQVRKIMTKKIVTVPMGTPVPSALELMKDKRIRHLPVVDELDDIIGIVSLKDLANCDQFKQVPVELMMTSPVQYIEDSTSLKQATLLMLENKISCLMIADDKSNAIGILTTDDLLWHLAKLLKEDDKEPSLIRKAFDLQTVGLVANQMSNMGI